MLSHAGGSLTEVHTSDTREQMNIKHRMAPVGKIGLVREGKSKRKMHKKKSGAAHFRDDALGSFVYHINRQSHEGDIDR